MLIVTYDFRGKQHTKEYNRIFNIVLFWFIAVSGFAYNVGSDIPIYMQWYEDVSWDNIKTISDLYDYENHLMPGWNLLMLLCKSVSDNFVLPKMVIAIFCNWVIFRFIKLHSAYPLVSVLFYGVSLYLNMNFNALRQMIAVSIFLLSYDYLLNRKLIKYYLMVLIAYMFHSSALICLLFPLLNLFKLSRKTVLVSTVGIILISIVILLSDFKNVINTFILLSANYLSSDINELAEMYLNDVTGHGLNFNGILLIAFSLVMVGIIIIASYNDNKQDNMIYKISLVYCLFYSLNFSIGVVFSRLIQYVELFYICLLPLGVMQISRILVRNKSAKLMAIIILIILANRPINNFFRVNPQYDYPLIVQYHPYYSIFNPQIDPLRNTLFGSYE